MSPGQVFQSLVSLAVQGSTTNWFGLGCPGHCAGSLSWTLSSGAIGFLSGALCTLFLFRFSSPPDPVPAATVPRPPAHLRLRGYSVHGSGARPEHL